MAVYSQDGSAWADERRNRPRANTAHVYGDRYDTSDGESSMPTQASRPSIWSGRVASSNNAYDSPSREVSGLHLSSASRPANDRAATFQGPTEIYQEESSMAMPKMKRIPTDPSALHKTRGPLRPVHHINTGGDVFGDPPEDSVYSNSSPDRSYGERSASPATSYGSVPSRTASSTTLHAGLTMSKKGPPPPPPSRAKKPPPPPPMKRSALSTSNMQYD